MTDKADDGTPLPPGAQIKELVFDPMGMLERHPDIQKGPAELLAAFQADNPEMPREVCAAFALQFVQMLVQPAPGMEERYLESIEWLRQQMGTYKVVDHTGGELEAAKKANEWRQG